MTAMPPLLQLAEGHKVRARLAPVYRPRESRLHCDVATLLRDHILPEWRYRFINATAKDARTGAIFKKMGAVAGWPDFIIISPRGCANFIELKRAGKKLDDDPQIGFREWCIECGIPHAVCYTIDEVLAACDAWGCLRIRGICAHLSGVVP